MGPEYRETVNGVPAFEGSGKNHTLRVYERSHWVPGIGDVNYNRGGLYFDYLLDGEMIVKKSFAGIYDVARELRSRGFSGRVMIVDEKSNRNLLFGDIDRLAELTITENDERGFQIIKWKPMPEEMKARFRAQKKEGTG